MGTVMPEEYLDGEAQDIETIARLRSWLEDEWQAKNGKFTSTKLITDYDAEANIFKFKLYFIK